MYSNFNFTEGAYKCPLLMFMYLSSLSSSHLDQLVEKRQIEEENGSTPPYCINKITKDAATTDTTTTLPPSTHAARPHHFRKKQTI